MCRVVTLDLTKQMENKEERHLLLGCEIGGKYIK